ncbi:hypothetical protein GJ496_004719 [Pomphorhynchus laevis]|nr:hypothetical protein GJ496_004719 [Pomphorhynchus laevis]
MNGDNHNQCLNNDDACKIVKIAPGQQVCVTTTTYCLSPPPDRTKENRCNPVITIQCCPNDSGQNYCITPDDHGHNSHYSPRHGGYNRTLNHTNTWSRNQHNPAGGRFGSFYRINENDEVNYDANRQFNFKY